MMEKYKIDKKIGQGVHSVVYKVKDANNNFLVAKEIECVDVPTSQKAYQEILSKLNHKYLCKIHDVFVKWDKDITNSLVCFVMDFYHKQDLLTYLKSLRELSQPIPLSTLKRFFGMIFEGIYYLNRKGINHRNLKSNSIYLHSKANKHDLSDVILQIGDYGILTIMKDARTKTRIPPGAFDYVAPEVIDSQEYNEKTDIWSLGCVLLDMATTALYDHETFRGKLLKIRFSDDDLDEVIDDVNKVYDNKQLNDFLKYLLHKDANKRPNFKYLLERSFTRESLNLINSELVKYNGMKDAGPSDISLPDDNTATSLLEFISLNPKHESRVQSALIALNDLKNLNELNLLESNNKELLTKLMTEYIENVRIQSTLLNIISNSIFNSRQKSLNETNSLIDESFIKNFLYVFIKYKDSFDIQLNASKVLVELSYFDNIIPFIYNLKIAKYLVQSIRNFESNANFCANVCKALWSLAVHDRLRKSYRDVNITILLKNLLLKHKNDSFCVEMALNLVVALTMDERILNDEELEANITSGIIIALEKNVKSYSIVKSACQSLSALIRLHEDCAFKFTYIPKSESNDEFEGVKILKKCYDVHKDNSEIVENIIQVFKSLCIYDEMISELKSLKLSDTLIAEASKRYRDNQVILLLTLS